MYLFQSLVYLRYGSEQHTHSKKDLLLVFFMNFVEKFEKP